MAPGTATERCQTTGLAIHISILFLSELHWWGTPSLTSGIRTICSPRCHIYLATHYIAQHRNSAESHFSATGGTGWYQQDKLLLEQPWRFKPKPDLKARGNLDNCSIPFCLLHSVKVGENRKQLIQDNSAKGGCWHEKTIKHRGVLSGSCPRPNLHDQEAAGMLCVAEQPNLWPFSTIFITVQ